MFLLFLISFLFLNPGNEALPIFERANPPSPSTLDTFTSKRSVYSIVWSCIVTTFLCAWVSLHPNTLRRLGGSWQRAGQRVRLFLLTVIAPELVIGLAWMVRQAARNTKVEFWNKGIGISMRHAHFVEMGGFALCFPEDKVRAELRQEKREAKTMNNNDEMAMKNDENAQVVTAHNEEPIQQVTRDVRDDHTMMKDENMLIAEDGLVQLRYIETLSAQRFQEILQSEPPLVRFPLITKCELGDRSKTNVLAKFITAIQALWFIVQCVVRGAKGLVITELELTTLALASLNALMLFLWRDKPRDIEVQVPVYLLKDSTEWGKTWEENKKEWEKRKEALETEKSREKAEKNLAIWHRTLLVLWGFLRSPWRFLFTLENWKKFWKGFFAHRRQYSEVGSSLESEEYITAEILLEFLTAGPDNIRLWLLAPVNFTSLTGWAHFLLKIISIISFTPTLLVFFSPTPILFLLLKSGRVRYFFNTYLTRERGVTLAYAVQAVIVGTGFGGLHLVALSGAFYFPTETEKTLWVTMSSALTIIPYLFASFALTTNTLARVLTSGRLSRLLDFAMPIIRLIQIVLTIFYFNLCILLLFTYTSARLCIIALTFAMLRSQPATAYLAINWTKIFPHASS